MWIQRDDLGISMAGVPFETFCLEDWRSAIAAMVELEAGSIANPTESRQVGHYWLRNSNIAPEMYRQEIEDSWQQLDRISEVVSDRNISTLLMVGVGGSALGPQLLVDALSSNGTQVIFLDNTDPDGFDRVLSKVDLQSTLIAVLSKSGGTKETRNAMIEVQLTCHRHDVSFEERAVAITVNGSKLHTMATDNGWLGTLPLWDWVGGRTSITGMVGLFPLLLMGRDWRAFLSGAATMDAWTREYSSTNPALQLAHLWYSEGLGIGQRNMVVLPYKDSLSLFAKYLQQLIMESIGKKHDRDGQVVHQGLTVYGNKGSTDQHAFVQQLRDGRHDFFALLIGVLTDRISQKDSDEVEPGVTAGQYLLGFLLGTRHALLDAERTVVSLFLEKVDETSLGALIALFERTVGLYAERLNINAYDQPGVEAGKKAAGEMLELRQRMVQGKDVSTADPVDVWVWKNHAHLN